MLVSPVLVELLAPGGRVAAEVAHQALLLVHRVDVVPDSLVALVGGEVAERALERLQLGGPVAAVIISGG